MGVKLEISGIEYDVEDYSVVEESTPLSLDDTAQSTGSISAVIRAPEKFSPGRRLYDEREINSVSSPIVRPEHLSFDPSVYEVTLESEGVRVEKVAVSPSAAPVRIGSPELSTVRQTLRYRGSGRSRYSSSALPPFAPSSELGMSGWISLNPSGWWILSFPTPEGLSYPGFPIISVELENVGDWIEISRRSSREDTLTGNSPDYRTSSRSLETTWRNEENNSPSISHWRWNSASSDLVSQLGLSQLQGTKFRLVDSRKGITSGTVEDVSFDGSGAIRLSGISDLNQLNSYNVTAFPTNLSDYPGFEGTLGEAVSYYAALSGVSYVWVDPAVRDIPVSYPGWSGETWFHLKQLATVHGCEISFVSGFPVFRPVRGRVTEPGRWTQKSISLTRPNLALSVEAYNQDVQNIRDAYVVHPDIGDGTVYSAVPGEVEDFVLDISASVYRLTSIEAVFTREDGRSVTWAGAGATVRINPENSRQLLLRLAPPESRRIQRVYLGWLRAGERVPGLYVRADGVSLTPVLESIPTGVPSGSTGTQVGVTLDSPFLGSSDTVGSALTRVSSHMSSTRFSLSGSLTNVNRRGDTGVPDFVNYTDAQEQLENRISPEFTYEELRTYMAFWESGSSYAYLQSLFSSGVSTDYRFQEFGNVAGSRIWDEETRRWFRIRSATITPFDIQGIQADDDLLLGEFLEPWEEAGWTYSDVLDSLPEGGPDVESTFLQGAVKLSYGQLQLMGVPVV